MKRCPYVGQDSVIRPSVVCQCVLRDGHKGSHVFKLPTIRGRK